MTSLKFLLLALVVLVISTGGAYCRYLSDEDKDQILWAHNHYRRSVQPQATNMNELVWNEELGYIAQYWAANCAYRQNEYRHSQSTEFGYVGEILSSTANYSINYTDIVWVWFGEGGYYDYQSGACLSDEGTEDERGETCQRYLQLVWADTQAVGCGAYRCNEIEAAKDDGEDAMFLVCNYGPGAKGIFYGHKPYYTGGKPCSDCSFDRPRCKQQLCSHADQAKWNNGLFVISMAALLMLAR